METSWSNFCRCCLSSETQVSLLDTEENLREKFFEVTTLEINADENLPVKLCAECNAIMDSAYQFKKQCIKMDNELRIQLMLNKKLSIDSKKDTLNPPTQEDLNVSQKVSNFAKEDSVAEMNQSDLMDEDIITNTAYAQLEALIKQEPNSDDDDCYYVLVIDDDMKNKDSSKQDDVLSEIITETIKKEVTDERYPSSSTNQNQFPSKFDEFLMSDTKVPVNVPATILENEESQDNYIDGMNIDESQDFNSMEDNDVAVDSFTNATQDIVKDSKDLIKILTSSDSDGTILLKSNDGIQYLSDKQLVNEDGELSQEVILCEGDETSQFQILKYDGSELVIEYADDSQIATVLQQEDGTFLCDCGEQFDDILEYEKHQYKHNPAGDNLCNLCGKGFESAEILAGHMLLHTISGTSITCPFCNQVVKRTALTQHIKYGHNNIKPRCAICMKTFANPNNLKRHLMIHNGVREFECDICLKRFSQKITMQTHRLTHMHPFPCNNCDKTFENKTKLTDHKESGQCDKSKVTKVKEGLMKTVKQEITTNLGKLVGYGCSLCNKMFSVESALEQHIENVHIVDPTELLCSECGEVLPSKKDMQIHVLTHKNLKLKNMKRFECSLCGKACSSQAMLVMHERVHTNERPFPCQLCTLRFKTKTHLRTHQLTHTREKKFGCSVCMKFFALKGNLVVHLRTHTGERPYICMLCGEAFIDSKYLKKHRLKKHSLGNVQWIQ